MSEWTSVKDGLPTEHDSIFKKYYGTDKWREAMFKSVSDEVIVTLELEDGSKLVTTNKTIDGQWKKIYSLPHKITHWMPLPEPPKGEGR